jgi:hypothetical protein
MYGMAKEKFARLGAERFMSLDITAYLAGLERALRWLEEAEDPREVEPPAFEPPRIVLLPEVTKYD